MDEIADIFIVGGGINGAGIARDAVGRGLKVLLAERDDLASHTSSASSKLIHGGLRYLEHYEFRLVRESLIEREVLLKSAPHLIRPMRFLLPHHKAMRSALLLRLGLWLYDNIGGRELLPPTSMRDLSTHATGAPLKEHFKKGFEYSDCWVDDARLVLHAAMDAAERGAIIMTRTEVIKASRTNGIWTITVQDESGASRDYQARALVNAAGPWVDHMESLSSPTPSSKKQVRMVKGSHIVVPKLYDGAQAYTFQHTDNRVIFAVPYSEDFTLVGTTDVPFEGDASRVAISAEERQYLCDAVSHYFTKQVLNADIVWTYAGVRPLVDDGAASASKATRDYVLELDTQEQAPILSVYGGKVTTFRCLAEEAMDLLQPHLGFDAPTWTEGAVLPGGTMTYAGLEEFKASMAQLYPWMGPAQRDRMISAYGTKLHDILGDAAAITDLGQHFGAGLYEAELVHMRDKEWARTADDVLWRRSKLGLYMSAAQYKAVQEWLDTA